MTVRDSVLITINLISDNPSAGEQLVSERLVAQGYSILQAVILTAFVPLGLARAVIARLRVNPPIKFPDTALIFDHARDRLLKVRLIDVPEYVVAHQLGEETFSTGIIPEEQFRAASGFSAELRLVNDALQARKELGGAKISPPVLLNLAEAPGFEEWYRAKKPKIWRYLRWS